MLKMVILRESTGMTYHIDMNYQNEQFEDADIALLRAKVQVAIDELDRGEGVPLDIEDIIARGKERLAARCDESAETR